MSEQVLYIKGMVCGRCLVSVQQALEKLGLQVKQVRLGEVTVEALHSVDMEQVSRALEPLGFALLQRSEAQLVQQVKQLAALVYSGDFDFTPGFRFSRYAAQQVQKTVTEINAAFIEKEGRTLEHFLIDFRVEKIKEMLVYTSRPLSDIAFQLGFSSVPHLSKLFKNSTGLTPSYFRAVRKDKLRLQHHETP